MRISVILFVLLLPLIGSPASAENDLIEVSIRCPGRAELVAAYNNPINFKNHLQGSYSDTGGQSGNLDFEGEGGGTVDDIPFESVSRNGQRIECRYRAFCSGAGVLTAAYVYKVKREIVTCVPRNSEKRIVCKVKP